MLFLGQFHYFKYIAAGKNNLAKMPKKMET